MDSFVLVAYASLVVSRTFLKQLLACLNLRFKRFTPLVQTKKSDFYKLWLQHKLLKNQKCMRFDLILTMRDIYINSHLNPLTKFTTSSRTTEFKDILPQNISQMITKTIPISARIVISYVMKWGILFWVYWKVNDDQDFSMVGKSL